MDFLLESSPFQDPGDPGDSHGYPNSVRGNNRGPIYKEFPMKGGSDHPQYREFRPWHVLFFFQNLIWDFKVADGQLPINQDSTSVIRVPKVWVDMYGMVVWLV